MNNTDPCCHDTDSDEAIGIGDDGVLLEEDYPDLLSSAKMEEDDGAGEEVEEEDEDE